MGRWIGLAFASVIIASSLFLVCWPHPLVAGGLGDRQSPAANPNRHEFVTLPVGTKIIIRIKEAMAIDTYDAGEEFTAVLYGPIINGSNYLAPSRSKIIGLLTKAREESPGESGFAIELRTLIINGRDYAIQTELLELTGPVYGLRNHQGAPGMKIVFVPEASFKLTLSAPVALPVIRKMNAAGHVY